MGKYFSVEHARMLGEMEGMRDRLQMEQALSQKVFERAHRFISQNIQQEGGYRVVEDALPQELVDELNHAYQHGYMRGALGK